MNAKLRTHSGSAREGGKRWTLDDIPWDKFDSTRVAAEIVPVVKTASLVEYNSADYAAYLHNVFRMIRRSKKRWTPGPWKSDNTVRRLGDGPRRSMPASISRQASGTSSMASGSIESSESVRGSRSGELIARCVVESGTSSMYSALRDATDEPVLKVICHRIAGDEFRYQLFYRTCRCTCRKKGYR